MYEGRGSGQARPRRLAAAGHLAARLRKAVARGDVSDFIEPDVGFDVLRQVIDNGEIRLRRALAERLGDRPDMPHDLALALANDYIDVAYPIVARSPVLRDDDLIGLIHDHGHDRHLAIAARPTLGPTVTEMLVELADEDVVRHVLDNDGARFFSHTIRRLAVIARDIESLQAALIARPEVDRDVARVLHLWGGDALRLAITQRFGIEIADELQTDEGRAAAEQYARNYMHDCSWPDPGVSARAPASRRNAATRPLVRALREDDLAAVEAAVGEMTGLPESAVTLILDNPAPEPLAVVCRALDLPRPMFCSTYLRFHGVRPYTTFRQTPTFRKALSCFNRLQANQARALLDTWRRAPVTVWRHVDSA